MNFQQYIDLIGIQKLADSLDVTRGVVYAWRAIDSVPRPETAFKMIALSQGVLTWEKIYKPFAEKNLKGEKFRVDIDAGNGSQIEFNFK